MLPLLVWLWAPPALAQNCSEEPSVIEDLSLALAATPPSSSETEPESESPVGAGSAPEAPSSEVLTPTYYYQYANQRFPWASCQNTSIAMLLSAYGVEVTPDEITDRFGKNKAQSPEGLEAVFNYYAAQAGIEERLEATRSGTLEEFQALSAGEDPVIVHGYFTAGHVVVALGKTDEGYVVNDPAGAWTERFRGGYAGGNATNGEGVVYDGSSFRKAVGTSNGATPLPLWYHEITP